MAANLVAEHARKGMKALKTQQGLAALESALRTSLPVIQIADMNWKSIAKRGDLAPWMQLMAKDVQATDKGQLITLLQQVDKTARQAVLLSELTRILEDTLGTKGIARDKGFFELGMDSLMAVEARNRIQQALGSEYKVSNTLLFEHTDLSKLSLYISTLLVHLFDVNLKETSIEEEADNFLSQFNEGIIASNE